MEIFSSGPTLKTSRILTGTVQQTRCQTVSISTTIKIMPICLIVTEPRQILLLGSTSTASTIPASTVIKEC